jgi:ABC-type siderophore export system fused ATPase/permease subunit
MAQMYTEEKAKKTLEIAQEKFIEAKFTHSRRAIEVCKQISKNLENDSFKKQYDSELEELRKSIDSSIYNRYNNDMDFLTKSIMLSVALLSISVGVFLYFSGFNLICSISSGFIIITIVWLIGNIEAIKELINHD